MKDDRIELRVDPKEREVFMDASTLLGVTLSSFLRQAALEKSLSILRGSHTLTLTEKDRDIFLDALERPPKPNKSLQAAFKSYQKKKLSSN